MGTDIHLAAEIEIFDDDGHHLRWELLPGPVVTCDMCQGLGVVTLEHFPRAQPDRIGERCFWCGEGPISGEGTDWAYPNTRYHPDTGKFVDSWYSDRNYTVFAALANVRNGVGFAGVYTHEPLEPIAPDRGIPDDIDPRTRDILSDEHSQTWVLLSEILTYDWDQPMRRSGTLTMEDFAGYLEHGIPQSWSGDISGDRVQEVTVEHMRELVANPPPDAVAKFSGGEGTLYTCRLQWTAPLRDFAQQFLDRMKQLAELAGEVPVRLVMDFDS